MILNKYGNRKVSVNGIKFDSVKEARRYIDLSLLQRAGEILENPDQVIADVMSTVQAAVKELIEPLEARLQNPGPLNLSLNNAMSEITAWGTNVAKQFLGMLWDAAWGVPTILIYVNFLFMGMFFIAKDYEKLLAFLPHRRKNLTDTVNSCQFLCCQLKGRVAADGGNVDANLGDERQFSYFFLCKTL